MGADFSQKPDRWRLIDTGALDGPSNMAIDEALLLHFNPDRSLPVLRLYGWKPPAFSLGRFQDAAEALHMERCTAADISVVRRITGGGLIYHADELTYSIVCGQRHIPGGRGVKESFRTLCTFLLNAYRKLGLDPSFAVDLDTCQARLGVRTPLCFAGKEEYDILVNGKKIGGNAQRRLRDVIFQHGSIPIHNSIPESIRFVRHIPPGLEEGATSLAELLNEMELSFIKEQMISSFGECLGVILEPCGLSGEEAETASCLLATKYGNEAWNRDGVAQ